MKLRVFDRDERALITVTVGRFDVRLLLWVRPCIEWGRLGYDCIWRTWAVYPLFEVEAIDPWVYKPTCNDVK
jgi:hypothetical protein